MNLYNAFLPPNVLLVATPRGYHHYKNGVSHITNPPPTFNMVATTWGCHLFYTAELETVIRSFITTLLTGLIP